LQIGIAFGPNQMASSGAISFGLFAAVVGLFKALERGHQPVMVFAPESVFMVHGLRANQIENGFMLIYSIWKTAAIPDYQVGLITLRDSEDKRVSISLTSNSAKFSFADKSSVEQELPINSGEWCNLAVSCQPVAGEHSVKVAVVANKQHLPELTFRFVWFAPGALGCIIGGAVSQAALQSQMTVFR
jgi:hypothetical protein